MTTINLSLDYVGTGLNDLMESKGGKKSSSSSSSKSLFYEAPLGYSIEDIRPNGGIKKFRSAAYSNVSFLLLIISHLVPGSLVNFLLMPIILYDLLINNLILRPVFSDSLQCARKPS